MEPTQKNLEKSKKEFPVVGIGASAGGLDAFKIFLKAIKKNSGMAYVIVQHLDPNHASLLPDILPKWSTIPIMEIVDDIELMPDNVYIIPSNKILFADDGVLRLAPRDNGDKGKKRLPIDLFFESLATVHESAAVGVILSGTGSDGTKGLMAIKDNGGITFAQEEASAQWPEMPQSAIKSGAVDFVLPAEKIPENILRASNSINGKDQGEETQKEDQDFFRKVISLLRESKGTDFTFYKQTTIRRRILRRMVLNQEKDKGRYINVLEQNELELNQLYQDMLIPVTDFFRNPEIFERVCARVLPSITHNESFKGSIRIWIVGCSTGQEAYSIAMCVTDFLARQFRDKDYGTKHVQIFATDISEPAIDKARKGEYSEKEVENIPGNKLKEFFTLHDGIYRVKKELRTMCIFAVHDILRDPPFSDMNLVSCRNVLIYFQPPLQKKALSIFHYSLNPKGFLLLGKSESGDGEPSMFSAVSSGDRLFSPRDTPNNFVMSHLHKKERQVRGNDKKAQNEVPHANFGEVADDLLLREYTPCGAVVDEFLDIVDYKGDTSDYLVQQGGRPSQNLIKLAKPHLEIELKTLLSDVVKKGERIVKADVPLSLKGEPYTVTIEALPLPNLVDPYYLVLFHSKKVRENSKNIEGDNGQREIYIAQLEKERHRTRKDMRILFDGQEAAREELQNANEELLSGSEELQTVNEELETSKEELESTNEELTMLNQELLSVNKKLEEERNYAKTINRAIIEPLVVLDNDLRIVSANGIFYETFKVNPEKTEGKLFFNLGNNQWDIPQLRKLLETIIPNQESFFDYEVTHDFPNIGRRTMLLNAQEIQNQYEPKSLILLAIEDITERRRAELKLKESLYRYDEMINNSPTFIAILKGRDLIIEVANNAIFEIWGKGKDILGKPFMEVLPEMKDQGMGELFYEVLETGKQFRAQEMQIEHFRNGELRKGYFNLTYQPQRNVAGEIEGISIIASDVTEKTRLHQHIKESEHKYQLMTEFSPDMITTADPDGNVFYFNRRWSEFSGKSIEEIKKDGWEHLIHPDDREEISEKWGRAVREGTDFEMEVRCLDRNGIAQWHLAKALPVKDGNGNIKCWIGVNTEIQRLKEEEKRKQGFLKIVSHELKTPITSIKGYTQLLLSVLQEENVPLSVPAPIVPSLERINNQVTKLMRLINELLDLSRLEESRLELQMETFSMNDLAMEVIQDIEYSSRDSEINLVHDAIVQVDADRDRIGQVLINFITNAVKYSPKNKKVEIHIFRTGENKAAVSVKDHGIGISEQDQEHIFERFYRSTGKNEETYSGFGIGLYLAKDIINRHGGTIEISSELGRGSTFTFFLDLKFET